MNGENICLLFHGIRKRSVRSDDLVNPDLFVEYEKLDELFEQLVSIGYKFVLPGDLSKEKKYLCSITFDDGYYNNSYFLPLSKKYKIPFVIFIASYNVINAHPFIWDLYKKFQRGILPVGKNYEELYLEFSGDQVNSLLDDNHRPFKLCELETLSKEKLVFFSNHTHTRTPFFNLNNQFFIDEIRQCGNFLSKFSNYLREDFAFPNGVFQKIGLLHTMSRFSRVHTIRGGRGISRKGMIHRISLISESSYIPLITQIEKSVSLKWWFSLKRLSIKTIYI